MYHFIPFTAYAGAVTDSMRLLRSVQTQLWQIKAAEPCRILEGCTMRHVVPHFGDPSDTLEIEVSCSITS